VRRLGEEKVLIVNNLSSSAQAVELNLQMYKRHIPIEMFGQKPFPSHWDLPYLLTLGPLPVFIGSVFVEFDCAFDAAEILPAYTQIVAS